MRTRSTCCAGRRRSDRHPWLPDLVLLEDSGGDWSPYVELVYSYFYADFVRDRPTYGGKRLGLKRLPMEQGKEATFWHMTSEGPVEEERTPTCVAASASAGHGRRSTAVRARS